MVANDQPLALAFSPCPNDTFIFYAWVHGLVPQAPEVRADLADIDVLNAWALEARADIIKVSVGVLPYIQENYALLHCGGALGFGCGPLLVARKDSWLRPAPDVRRVARFVDELERARIAVPGEYTTAALLLRLLVGQHKKTIVLRYDEIMPAVAEQMVDAGVIIHEGRFLYGAYGLRCLLDLGLWWESTTQMPIPLGVIAIRRDLPLEVKQAAEQALRSSIIFAREHPDASKEYVLSHAQAVDYQVCHQHIELYVNNFTLGYGAEGEAAVREMLTLMAEKGIAPAWQQPLWWDETAAR